MGWGTGWTRSEQAAGRPGWQARGQGCAIGGATGGEAGGPAGVAAGWGPGPRGLEGGRAGRRPGLGPLRKQDKPARPAPRAPGLLACRVWRRGGVELCQHGLGVEDEVAACVRGFGARWIDEGRVGRAVSRVGEVGPRLTAGCCCGSSEYLSAHRGIAGAARLCGCSKRRGPRKCRQARALRLAAASPGAALIRSYVQATAGLEGPLRVASGKAGRVHVRGAVVLEGTSVHAHANLNLRPPTLKRGAAHP